MKCNITPPKVTNPSVMVSSGSELGGLRENQEVITMMFKGEISSRWATQTAG